MTDEGPSVLHKHPKTRRFVQIENDIARAPNLSLKAVGLLLHILSLPDGDPVGSRVIAACRPDGRTAIMSAYRELKEAGHVEQERIQQPSGRWVTVTHVYECPCDRGQETDPRHRGQVLSHDRGQETSPSKALRPTAKELGSSRIPGGDEMRANFQRARRDLKGA